jgi:hypothetical protein
MAKIGLKTLVAELLDAKDSSSQEFRRLYNIGVRGLREFNTDVVGTFVTALLPVNANKTVTLPPDYINYSKMGVINERGEIVTLRLNQQLSTYNDGHSTKQGRFENVPTLNTVTSPGVPYGYPFIYFNFFVSNQSYNLFGIGGGGQDIGEYKVDEHCGVIVLGPYFQWDKVLFEYLSDGMDCENDDYMVDSRAAEAMVSYMRWKSALDAPKKYGQGMIREYKSDYLSERKKAKMRINSIKVSEFDDMHRITSKLAPRA